MFKQNLIVIQNQSTDSAFLHKDDKLNLQDAQETQPETPDIKCRKSCQLSTEQQAFNSNSFKNLSPFMKEMSNDVFKLVKNEATYYST